MVKNPFETRSDSFYFIDETLMMHNKADYAYDGGLKWSLSFMCYGSSSHVSS